MNCTAACRTARAADRRGGQTTPLSRDAGSAIATSGGRNIPLYCTRPYEAVPGVPGVPGMLGNVAAP